MGENTMDRGHGLTFPSFKNLFLFSLYDKLFNLYYIDTQKNILWKSVYYFTFHSERIAKNHCVKKQLFELYRERAWFFIVAIYYRNIIIECHFQLM